MTFRRYLWSCRKDDSRIGDLARDLFRDPCSRYLRTPASIRRHIEEVHHGSGCALGALEVAEFLWIRAEGHQGDSG
jgi:hypothetical protein